MALIKLSGFFMLGYLGAYFLKQPLAWAAGACVASACRFLGVPPPPPGMPYPPVFVGDYTPPAGWAMRWLRWRFRRERRALARRHGIDFDA